MAVAKLADGVRLATVLDNAVCSPELILQEKSTKEPAFFLQSSASRRDPI
jgi:hypothetical protein